VMANSLVYWTRDLIHAGLLAASLLLIAASAAIVAFGAGWWVNLRTIP